jgi:hypothetical protein
MITVLFNTYRSEGSANQKLTQLSNLNVEMTIVHSNTKDVLDKIHYRGASVVFSDPTK